MKKKSTFIVSKTNPTKPQEKELTPDKYTFMVAHIALGVALGTSIYRCEPAKAAQPASGQAAPLLISTAAGLLHTNGARQ